MNIFTNKKEKKIENITHDERIPENTDGVTPETIKEELQRELKKLDMKQKIIVILEEVKKEKYYPVINWAGILNQAQYNPNREIIRQTYGVYLYEKKIFTLTNCFDERDHKVHLSPLKDTIVAVLIHSKRISIEARNHLLPDYDPGTSIKKLYCVLCKKETDHIVLQMECVTCFFCGHWGNRQPTASCIICLTDKQKLHEKSKEGKKK